VGVFGTAVGIIGVLVGGIGTGVAADAVILPRSQRVKERPTRSGTLGIANQR
jgi:hypothetical protein